MLTNAEILAAIEAHGSQRKAAKALGIARTSIQQRLLRMNRAPLETPQIVSGKSTLYRTEAENGDVVLEWIKTNAEHGAALNALQAAAEALKGDIPRVTIPIASGETNSDLLNVYTITDYHLGMLSWHEETGADWDMKIAEDLMVAWFAKAINAAPAAESCVFAQLGDLLHFDSLDTVTPTNRHLLDSDTRFTLLVRAAIRVLTKVTEMLCAKYRKVHLLFAEGNHDLASSVWLRELFAARYENNPHITVETRPDPYYCYEHGETSLFWHHGHIKRIDSLDSIFVAKFRDVFGRTSKSYAHTGHLHHRVVKETNLMVLEQHRTLAAPDAYASRGGWMSGRDASVITYSKRFGEVGRVTISAQMAGEM